MNTKILPGYWYCDSLPDGSYVASRFGDDVNIFNGLEANGKELIYTVIGPDTKFTGLGFNDHAYEYEWDGQFLDRGKIEGPRAAIYKGSELILIRSVVNAPTGSQGLRYIDDEGNPVSADDSINPDSRIARKFNIKDLWQYTYLNGIAVGEGEFDVWAVIDGHRISLTKVWADSENSKIDSIFDKVKDKNQNARAVHFHRDGDSLSISWYYFKSPTDYTACFIWMKVDELRALITDDPIEDKKETMIKAFDRPIWQAPFFSYSRQYGNTPINEFNGNAIWTTYDEAEDVLGFNLPIIVHANSVVFEKPGVLNQTIAWWVSRTSPNELRDRIIEVIKNYPEKPIIAYLDGDSWPDTNPFEGDRVWPSIQAYRFPSESLIDFDNRVSAVLSRVSSYNLSLFITTRFDDFNGDSTIDKIVECMPLYEAWIRDYNVIGHMPFSDRRGNGIASNETLKSHAKSFLYAIPFERPNRFDYWRPSGSSIKSILENKLGQSRAGVVLEKYLREDILRRYL